MDQNQWLIAGALGLGVLAMMSNRAGGSTKDHDSGVVFMWKQLDVLQRQAAAAVANVDQERLRTEGFMDTLDSEEITNIRRQLRELREEGGKVFDERRAHLAEMASASEDYAGEESITVFLQDHDTQTDKFLAAVDHLEYDLRTMQDDAESFRAVVANYQAVAMQKKTLELHQQIAILKQQDVIVEQTFNQELHVHADELHQHRHQQNFFRQENYDNRVVELHGGPNNFLGGHGPGGGGGGGGGMDDDDDDKFTVSKEVTKRGGKWRAKQVGGLVGAVGGNNALNVIGWSPDNDVSMPPTDDPGVSSSSFFQTSVNPPANTLDALRHSQLDASSGFISNDPLPSARIVASLPGLGAGGRSPDLVIIGPLDDNDDPIDNGPKGFSNAPTPPEINTDMRAPQSPRPVKPSFAAGKQLRDMNDGEKEGMRSREWAERGNFDDPAPGDPALQQYILEVDRMTRSAKISNSITEINKVRDVLYKFQLGRETKGIENTYVKWSIAKFDPHDQESAQFPGYRVWADAVEKLTNRLYILGGQNKVVQRDGTIRAGKSKASTRADMLNVSDRLGKTKRARTSFATGQAVSSIGGLDIGYAEGALNQSGINNMAAPSPPVRSDAGGFGDT